MIELHTKTPPAGFADPTADTQSVFRAVMMALARPGKVTSLPLLPAAPDALPPALAAIALTLADYETPIWLDRELVAVEEVARFLSFHTGAPLVAQPAQAAFAFASSAAALPPFAAFAQGTHEYPDRSTTVVAHVASLVNGPRQIITGPGIDGEMSIAPTPLPPDFPARMADNRARFPCGVDLILAADDAVIGLPRTVQFAEEG